jgi:hypothetical protein
MLAQAMQEVKRLALQGTNPTSEIAADDYEEKDKEDSIAEPEEDSSDDSELLRPLS